MREPIIQKHTETLNDGVIQYWELEISVQINKPLTAIRGLFAYEHKWIRSPLYQGFYGGVKFYEHYI